jgi:dephospho-CoA kinase
MKIIGITGGIGSGKTIVSQIFAKLDVPVYEADKAAHALYDKYPEIIDLIKNEFSEEVMDKNGKINRKKLGEIVFADQQKLSVLNKIVHPFVKTDFSEWFKNKKGYSYVLKEAAILFESGTDKDCDKVITISSPLEIRIARIRERDHKTKSEIELVISKQLSDEERIERSDFVIYNDEKQLVIPQVLKIHSILIK